MVAIEDKFAKKYAALGGNNVGVVPWASIIELVLSLFGGCTAPKAAKRWMRRHPEAAKEMISEKLKGEESFTASKNRNAAVEAAYATFLSTPDNVIESMR